MTERRCTAPYDPRCPMCVEAHGNASMTPNQASPVGFDIARMYRPAVLPVVAEFMTRERVFIAAMRASAPAAPLGGVASI